MKNGLPSRVAQNDPSNHRFSSRAEPTLAQYSGLGPKIEIRRGPGPTQPRKLPRSVVCPATKTSGR